MTTFYLAVVIFCICQFPFILTQMPTEGVRIIDEDDQGGRCEAVTPDTRCITVGYPMAYFPNFRGHETRLEAATELSDYTLLIDSGCSDYLLQFLCGFYLPFCFTSSQSEVSRLRPCKSLCEAARQNCSEVLSENSELQWPTFLNCSLDTFPCDSPFCFGPSDLPTPLSCIETATTTDHVADTTATIVVVSDY